jgi:hypothetical protein
MNGCLTPWHIKVAAEAVAAAQFARCGFAVSVQYGADQPEYDLVVTREDRAMKVSVKGSQDGSWGLTQSFKRGQTYHGAIDLWLPRHSPGTVFCFVQFKGVAFSDLPRLYLASPREVADRLHSTAKGRGDTILYEAHEWKSRAHAAGTIEEIPPSWRFTKERIEGLLAEGAAREPLGIGAGTAYGAYQELSKKPGGRNPTRCR